MGSNFAQWLQRQIERREWDQARLARETRSSSGAVSMWLTGQRVPSPKSIERIADALDFDPDYVLALAGHRSGVLDGEVDELKEDLHALIEGHPRPITDDLVEALRSVLKLHADQLVPQ